jgi:hypothetical protein
VVAGIYIHPTVRTTWIEATYLCPRKRAILHSKSPYTTPPEVDFFGNAGIMA